MDKKIILVVEDDELILELVANALEKDGFVVVRARNGEEGLKKASQSRPHLIILDIVMPKMDGLTMMKKLRQEKWGEKIPIIMLTAQNTSKDISESMDNKVFRIFIKSDWDVQEVVKAVRNRLDLDKWK